MNLIESEYQKIKNATLEKWNSSSVEGRNVGFPYEEKLYGVTSGIKFSPKGELSSLLLDLRETKKGNQDLDVTSDENLHFTFLALSPLVYPCKEDLPVEISELRRVSKILKGNGFSISKLRLVPLKNAILLAGIPSSASLELRDYYAKLLLTSNWSLYLKERYEGFEIPPPIWHTTLVRSRRELASEAVREIYNKYRDTSFGDLIFQKIDLVAANYNWSKVMNI